MNKRIRIAFIKFAGLANYGTEKFLQVIAANLPKDQFEVDYYYTNAAPYIGSDWKHPDNSEERKKYLLENGVNVIPVNVEYKDVTNPIHPWINTNFWDLFKESNYDIIQTGRAGHPEYPFINILRCPIVDSIHLSGMVDVQKNIYAVIHVSNWNKEKWIQCGGNADLAHVVYHPIFIAEKFNFKNYLKELGIENKFVFGFHQRPDDGIYSNIPLDAYSKIETDDTAFVILGGSKKYSNQAKKLNLKNFNQINATTNIDEVYSFLKCLNIYTHGRSDGENNSQAIAEAMGFGLPVLSHKAVSNGHVEQIGNAGFVVDDINDYSMKMNYFIKNKELVSILSNNSKTRFNNHYNLTNNIKKIINIYEEVINKHNKIVIEDKWLLDWLDDSGGDNV